MFPSGQLLFSDGVIEMRIDVILSMLDRHLAGDWGDGLCPEDIAANDHAVHHCDAILSQYSATTPSGKRVMVSVFTEADRSVTLVFLQGEDR